MLPSLCGFLFLCGKKSTMENTPYNIQQTNTQQDEKREFEIDHLTLEQILAINEQRKSCLVDDYDPLSGRGCCGPRVEQHIDLGDEVSGTFFIPESMAAELKAEPCASSQQWELLRIRHDFEYWCATCVTILDKVSARMVNLVLNRPQRRVLQVLERQRLAGDPLRLIMLKARQWGGSTLVQIYMEWIQMVLRRNWNSLICGHLHQTSAIIKNIYQRALRNYPKHLCRDGVRPTFKSFEGSRNVRQLSSSESLVITGSALSQDAVRGYDVKMAHLTEVAFWPTTRMHSPEDVIRSISGTIPLEPLTMLAIESTANGVDNYFHSEWLRAKAGTSDKEAVFVPWYEIEIYRKSVANPQLLIDEMDDYEKWLWEDCGCTLEMINWYHSKRREYLTRNLMAAEFPTTDIEAFTCTSRNVFPVDIVDRMRHTAVMPMHRGDVVAKGENSLKDVDFVVNDTSGPMEMWVRPEHSQRRNRYMVVVDVGGRSDTSDWSVIAVIDRHLDSSDTSVHSRPEVVAQWRGHIYHDRLAWKAAQIAKYYDNALLVFESNTLECEGFIGSLNFDRIRAAYPNVYCRPGKEGRLKPGFQTNRDTKQSAIYNLLAYVRDGSYIEHDNKALNEMNSYELSPDGKRYEAHRGKHDDILMTRAIGLLIVEEMRLREGRSRAINPEFFIKKHPCLF